jgi:hypothetical protein
VTGDGNNVALTFGDTGIALPLRRPPARAVMGQSDSGRIAALLDDVNTVPRPPLAAAVRP